MTGRTQARSLAAALIIFSAVSVVLRLAFLPLDANGVPATLTSPFLMFSEDLQDTIHSLLTIPLGIIALVFVRQFIGLPTIGTFMPVLIGVSFRDTGVLYGLPLFILIVGIGMIFRFYFERLKLLLVPRLAAILIVVVIAMLGAAFLFTKLGLNIGQSVSLFPIVIMAMSIERMVMSWEENGAKETLLHSAGSVFVAVISYFIMTAPFAEDVMFLFPELLLVMLALAIMMGRYIGFRLTEYYRFRDVGRAI
ncbi:MAG: hypothetical protein CMK09_08485 [Ponticaulis sp.]|nr:hypothetical protein [Ponticaulis sp.]|tara:strand:+ start:8623 stop:9375 length:753 start_codon:yes stop_codon:yes gene_type:complete